MRGVGSGGLDNWREKTDSAAKSSQSTPSVFEKLVGNMHFRDILYNIHRNTIFCLDNGKVLTCFIIMVKIYFSIRSGGPNC